MRSHPLQNFNTIDPRYAITLDGPDGKPMTYDARDLTRLIEKTQKKKTRYEVPLGKRAFYLTPGEMHDIAAKMAGRSRSWPHASPSRVSNTPVRVPEGYELRAKRCLKLTPRKKASCISIYRRAVKELDRRGR